MMHRQSAIALTKRLNGQLSDIDIQSEDFFDRVRAIATEILKAGNVTRAVSEAHWIERGSDLLQLLLIWVVWEKQRGTAAAARQSPPDIRAVRLRLMAPYDNLAADLKPLLAELRRLGNPLFSSGASLFAGDDIGLVVAVATVRVATDFLDAAGAGS